MLGNTEGKRKRGQQGMRRLDSITDSMHMNLSNLWKTVWRQKDREAWCAAVHGVAKSWTLFSNWTTTISSKFQPCLCSQITREYPYSTPSTPFYQIVLYTEFLCLNWVEKFDLLPTSPFFGHWIKVCAVPVSVFIIGYINLIRKKGSLAETKGLGLDLNAGLVDQLQFLVTRIQEIQ